MTSLSDPPLSQKGGVGGTRAIAHSIRRCRAAGVAKLACYPGCCRCRRPPPSRCFLKVTLKNDALACISEHFCILKVSNLEKSEFSLKSFILLVFWRFLGILGESKNRQKTREIRQKITGRKRRPSGTVFGQFLLHFFANFKAQNTVKYSVFAIFVLKDNNVKCCKNIVNTDVFEGPCAENTVNTVVFGATCKKPRTYRVFSAFWLKSIGIYGVFWTPNAENCVNSMVLERFWTSGKQKLLVFTGFCECNAWKTLVFAGFSRVFFLWFYHCFASIDGSCMLTKRYLCAPRARARHMHPFLWSFHLGGIAGVRSLSIIHGSICLSNTSLHTSFCEFLYA